MNILPKNIDDKFLRDYPKLWILGLHTIVPLVIIIALGMFGLGFIIPLDLENLRDSSSVFTTLTLLGNLVAILLLILFAIRQIRFNSNRIHHRLPYDSGFGFFGAYLVVIIGIMSIPYMPNLGSYAHARIQTSNVVISEDADQYYDYYMEGRYENGLEELAYAVDHKRYMFYAASPEFWRWYSLVALGFAMLLFAVCTTKLSDFGWAMLYTALLPIVFSILSGIIVIGLLSSHMQEHDLKLVFGTLMAIIMGFLIYNAIPRESNKRKRSFQISLFLLAPAIFSYYGFLIFEDNYVNSINTGIWLVALVAAYLFNNLFRWSYVNPH